MRQEQCAAICAVHGGIRLTEPGLEVSPALIGVVRCEHDGSSVFESLDFVDEAAGQTQQ
jgi:hypothetical protein